LVSSSRCRLWLVTRTAPLRLQSRAAEIAIDAAAVTAVDAAASVAAAVETVAVIVVETAADETEVATAAEIAGLATMDRETTVLAKSALPKLRL